VLRPCYFTPRLRTCSIFDNRGLMITPPETVRTNTPRVACDGASDVRGGAALGHPRVWLQIDEKGYVECGYCDRRFVLAGGPADVSAAA
jgi:NADH dehydrogenase (ubiquinone) Fe-S protein 6